MISRMPRRLCLLAVISGLPFLAAADTRTPEGSVRDASPARPQRLSSARLDDLVAPIALYPDPLLSQVLVASSYPLEVVEAQQWLKRNGGLKGKELTEAARQQDWDASVQALVAFPDVLDTLCQDVGWTRDLGNAFLDQEADVMAAVQRMRGRAKEGGRLSSTPEQTVSTADRDGRTAIQIVPADPQVIYVPQYDPAYVWGPPAWSSYPALDYGYGYGFGPGIDVGFWFGGWGLWAGWAGWGSWGWCPNWYGGGVYVNAPFFDHCGYRGGHWGGGHWEGRHADRGHGGSGHGGVGHGGGEPWRGDPGHRGGASSPNDRLASRNQTSGLTPGSTAGRQADWRSRAGTTPRSADRSSTVGPRGDAWRNVRPSRTDSWRNTPGVQRGAASAPRVSAPSRSYPSQAPRYQPAPPRSAPGIAGRSFGGGGGPRWSGTGGGTRGLGGGAPRIAGGGGGTRSFGGGGSHGSGSGGTRSFGGAGGSRGFGGGGGSRGSAGGRR